MGCFKGLNAMPIAALLSSGTMASAAPLVEISMAYAVNNGGLFGTIGFVQRPAVATGNGERDDR